MYRPFHFSMPLLIILLASLVGYAQTIPTTLEEMYGKEGIKIFNDSDIDYPAGGNWTQGSSMPFPRYYGGSVMYSDGTNEWLYVFGGDTTGSGDPTKTCLRYNVNTDTWEYIAPLPEPLRVNAATKLGDKLYTMGGFNAPFPAPAVTSFYEYDIATNTWTQLPDLPTPLFFTGAVGFEDSLIYIIGGIEDVQAARGDLWSLKVRLFRRAQGTFTDVDNLPEATANFGQAVIGNNFYLTGGLKSNSELWNLTIKGEVDPTDKSRINWTKGTNYPLSVHAHKGYKISDDEVYFFGGSTTTGFSPIRLSYSYNLISNSYSQEPDIPYDAMAFYAGINFREGNSATQFVTVIIAGGITNGPSLTGQTWIFKDTLLVQGINEIGNTTPQDYSLLQNFPNPFNPSTTIRFSIPREDFVTLKIFNSLGQSVTTLVSGKLTAGLYEYNWNAGTLSSGIYFYTLTAGKFSQTKKLILMK